MIIWGVTAMVHDAAIAVIEDGEILFAAHAERYSGIKQDKWLNLDLIKDALAYGHPDLVGFYENIWLKKTRQICSFQFLRAFDLDVFPQSYLRDMGIDAKVVCVNHHLSHAAAGYHTSDFNKAAVVVIDAVGEWDTITIWEGTCDNLILKDRVSFPSSLGLLYSAFTQRCGLKPNEEEYILMGMAAYGKPLYCDKIKKDFIGSGFFSLKKPCHYGIGDYLPNADILDIAASIQEVTKESVCKIMHRAKKLIESENLVYCGGVALNCVINNHLPEIFKNIWIMPNPGDAGASLGCAAHLYGGKVQWRGPYLGHKITGDLCVDEICRELSKGNIVGIANGRAEFGPRALGNRSLLADPRLPGMKDKVNEIKRRQKFRPFAASIMADIAQDYFIMDCDDSPYMQYAFKCNSPDKFPAICHVDGTSRIQTVTEAENEQFYNILKAYNEQYGCPMLLNTSLNIKGKPIVNSILDAKEFENHYKVRVF